MTDKNNLLDFQDPGAIGDELLDVPGFINELKNHTLAVSPRPNAVIAFAGALAMQAHLTGASYMDKRGATTNLYLAALAPTGMGKEEPRVTNKRLAAEVGILGSVPDAIASGEGLEDAIAATPSLLLQNDEADALLGVMRGSDSRAAKLNEMVLRFYSEAKSGHAMRIKAGQGKAQVIANPHLTLFATGIPKFVYQTLSAKALENGLLGRCLFLETDAFCRLGDAVRADLPALCVATAKALVARELAFRESGVMKPVVVDETPEATARFKTFREFADDTSLRLVESDLGTAAALYCRLYEKVVKLAIHHAISANAEKPVMTGESVAWAIALATHITKQMLYEAQFHVAEGKFDHLKKRFLAKLAKHGGKLDHSTLLRDLPVDAALFKRLVLTLKMCDLIEDEVLPSGKCQYLLKDVI